MADENSAVITRINYILKYLTIENICLKSYKLSNKCSLSKTLKKNHIYSKLLTDTKQIDKMNQMKCVLNE